MRMATAVKLSLATLLVGGLLLASLGPPPPRQAALRLRGVMLFGGFACYALAALALTTGAVVGGVLALTVASGLVCAAGWLGRGEPPPTDDDDGGGGGGGGGRGPKPPPLDWDWDAFEQAFRRYARERDRQPI
jgi:hypothetical protein